MPGLLIPTTRFGSIAIDQGDVIRFPQGLLGLDECFAWVLLADAQNDALGWLQSTTRAEIALVVVSPRRFVPDYQVRLARTELEPLELSRSEDAHVLVIVSKHDDAMTLNLRAPLVINLARHIGRQVVNRVELPLRYELQRPSVPLRKSA